MDKYGKTSPVVWILIGLVVLAVAGVVKIPSLNLGSLSVASDGATSTASQNEAAPSQQLVSDSVTLRATEKVSESQTNANGGLVRLFQPGTDPTDPSASAIATITIGTAYTTGDVVCGKKYRVVYDNGTNAYSHDFGDQVLIDCNVEYNKESADSFVDLTSKYGWKREVVATLDDIFDEAANGTILNGQASNSSISITTNEIGCASPGCNTDGTLLYDESQGDGTFYLDISPSASGTQAVLSEPVLCFRFDTTNPPETNEITAMSLQLRSGTDLGFPASTDWVQVFSNEDCVKANDMSSGTSSTYRLTITYNEANLDTNDDWFLDFDDLGGNRARDAMLNLGATRDTIAFDSQA